MPTIQELYGLDNVKPYVPKGLLAGERSIITPHRVRSKELIGIEVEIENVQVANRTELNKVWRTEGDGSLRNNGMEFITQPIAGEYAPVCLENLLNQYLSNECCFSPRTSVHIHMNMQDMTPEQVVDTVLLYVLYEKLFYRFTGRGRQKNIYCVPLADTDLMSHFASKRLDRNNWSKYTGLNLLPLQSYGTIEFRHMHGTYDVGKLTIWINLITKLKEYVKASTTKEIRTIIAQLDEDYPYHELLDNIFGEHAEHLKYSGLPDVNYLQVKQALANDKMLAALIVKASAEHAFFKFK